MFLLTKPNEESLRQFLETQRRSSFSYAEVGATRKSLAPANYTLDHNRVQLGRGYKIYGQAVQAIRNWQMFDLSWARLCFVGTPIDTGQTVAILVRHFGFWSLNAARIVYVLHDTSSAIEKFGFAYGTLTEHAERGEERFSVEYDKSDESVWYDLYAFSQPQHIWARVGYPVSRYLQKQFAIGSKAAMQRAVST